MSRWCGSCGLDLRPDLPPSEIPEARQAALLDQRWRHGGQPGPEAVVAPPTTTPVQHPSAPQAPPAAAEVFGARYRSARGQATVASILLGLSALLAAAVMLVDQRMVSELGSPTRTYESLSDAGASVDSLARMQLLLFLVAGIGFVVWMYRAYGNLPALGIRSPRYRRGFTIGAWFIPLANLVIPKRIADDLWRAGDPDLPPGDAGWRGRKVSPVLHWWWGLYLLSAVVSWHSAARLGSAELPDQLQAALRIDIWSQGLLIGAAVAGIWFIRRSTERQDSRSVALRASGHLPSWA